MPFSDALRQCLLVLKQEFESGLIPLNTYEEICKTAIQNELEASTKILGRRNGRIVQSLFKY